MSASTKKRTSSNRRTEVSDAVFRRAHAKVLKRYAPAFAALALHDRLRGNWRNLTSQAFIVLAVLHDVDPERLICIDAPADEYAPEARDIAAKIERGATIDGELVRSTWERFFVDDDAARRGVRAPMRMRPAFVRAASKIKRALAGGGT
jgi:hypothetical protein